MLKLYKNKFKQIIILREEDNMAGVADVGETTNNSTGVTGKINLEEARTRADSLIKSAVTMKSILDAVNEQMNRIGDSENDQTVSYASRSDTEIRAEFERLYAEFPRFYEEINKNAEDIKTIANTMEQEQ